MSENDKRIYEQIQREIQAKYKTPVSLEQIDLVVKNYFEFIQHCVQNITSVRIPGVGKMKVSYRRIYNTVTKLLLLEKGVSLRTIKMINKKGEHHKYISNIENHVKVFLDNKRRRISN